MPSDKLRTPSKQPPLAEQENPRFPLLVKSGLSFVWEVAKTVIIAVTIIVLIRHFLFKPFYVKGASMEPTFFDNEYLIINEIDYRFREPRRGDIVVLRYPRDPSQFFIKRVVGLPGEQIEFQDGKVAIVNAERPEGFLLDEGLYLHPQIQTIGADPVEIGTNEYFVLGDNRPASLDSRSLTLGPVPRSAIVGRAWFRIWPVNKFAIFESPEYVVP